MSPRSIIRVSQAAAWAMFVVGVALTPIGLWVTDEPPMIVLMSGAALVFEAIIALIVSYKPEGGGDGEAAPPADPRR